MRDFDRGILSLSSDSVSVIVDLVSCALHNNRFGCSHAHKIKKKSNYTTDSPEPHYFTFDLFTATYSSKEMREFITL